MEKAHRKLIAWQLSMQLATDVYQLTGQFPDSERYGLVSQMRRASVSVPSNIAEGAARLYRREFRRYLSNARGSLMELETQLILAERLEYTAETSHLHTTINRIFALLNGLIKRHAQHSGATRYEQGVREPRRPIYRLPSPVSRLPSSVFRLPSPVFRLPSSVFRLTIINQGFKDHS